MKKTLLFFLLASLMLTFKASAADDPAKALYDRAKELEKLSDSLTEKAEKECYWKKKTGSQACMQKFVNQYNTQYGAGSFELVPQLNVIRYTGIQYRQLIDQYPNSSYAGEADFTNLSKNLVGNPDEVFARVDAFLARHPSGEWYCQGLLLKARLEEDVWWIHKKWSWILYGYKLDDDDLIIKAEPFRQQGLKLFEKVEKECKGSVKEAAKTEKALLKDHKDDGKFYGIVNETMLGETAAPK